LIIKLLPGAREDLLAGYHFYEQQRPGLGQSFLDALYSDIESLHVTTGVHIVCFDHFLRLLSRRFPFAVYYQIVQHEIRVVAVLDCRRNPIRHHRELKSRLSRKL
jgi:hypothetical protein